MRGLWPSHQGNAGSLQCTCDAVPRAIDESGKLDYSDYGVSPVSLCDASTQSPGVRALSNGSWAQAERTRRQSQWLI